VPVDELQRDAAAQRALVAPSLQLELATVVGALRAIGARAVLNDGYAESARDRLQAPALGLVAKLDPAITVPARVMGRLTAGSGRSPRWLRPDWFADGRVEPVMAHPRFNYPMYEPLHRYDRDWMVPGVGLIERPDMATLLQTNNRFIEAYLTGLNHEMARELLWREFPTDQRGTYFSSFWTGVPELVADMHELSWRSGALERTSTLHSTVVSCSWCAATWSGAIPALSRTRCSTRAPIQGASRSSGRARPSRRCSMCFCRRTSCWSVSR
jgi:hypothetical protein